MSNITAFTARAITDSHLRRAREHCCLGNSVAASFAAVTDVAHWPRVARDTLDCMQYVYLEMMLQDENFCHLRLQMYSTVLHSCLLLLATGYYDRRKHHNSNRINVVIKSLMLFRLRSMDILTYYVIWLYGGRKQLSHVQVDLQHS